MSRSGFSAASAVSVVPSGSPELLPVAGFVRFSTTDWPGMLVATIFTQGCSWDCQYCHNPQLRPTMLPGSMSWASVVEFLRRRRGMLDGVVFSGGEPTRHKHLLTAMTQVKQLGFAVGLHTNGMYPSAVRQLLDAGVVDWVGLDIKSVPQHYPAAAGCGQKAAEKVFQCLDDVQRWDAGYGKLEVRTTVFPGGPMVADLAELAQKLRIAGVQRWVIQRALSRGTRRQFQRHLTVVGSGDDDKLDEAIEQSRVEFLQRASQSNSQGSGEGREFIVR